MNLFDMYLYLFMIYPYYEIFYNNWGKIRWLTSTESGQSDGNKGRRQREAMGRRQREAIAVSMIGGPYAQISPSIASANVGIRTGR